MSEAITNKQLGRVIDILFFLPVYRITNWENDNAMINLLARESGLTSDEVRRFMPLFLSNLQSLTTVNGTPIDFTSREKLIDLFGKDKFRNGREQLISSFLNLMNAQTQTPQSVSSTNFTNNQTQNQSSSNPYFQLMNLGMRMINQSPQLRNWYGEMVGEFASGMANRMGGPVIGQIAGSMARQMASQMFNQPRANSENNTIPTYNTNQNFQAQQVSSINQTQTQTQNSEIEKLVNFFKSILNGSYWQGNTRINLEALRDLSFDVDQIRAFINRLENANSFVSMRILNYENVTNLISKIDRNSLVTVRDAANVLFDISELYSDINRNENIPPFEKPRDFSKE